MGKNQNQRNNFQHKKKKVTTAVTFDENERHEYLKGMFGAKRRRK